jgi:hypothetical protein
MDRGASFEQVYGPMAKEITFEYLFFLKHFDIGYRVDLCSWDWKAKFRPARGANSFVAKIDAAAGWQPSRLEVREGETYEFSTTGDWTLCEEGEDLTAAGDADGKGKLVGIIFEDYQLSEPFELEAEGTFMAPKSGNLLLRCADEWHQLADNSGTISVKLKAAK